MDTPRSTRARLPIEICERIIDFFADSRTRAIHDRGQRQTLLNLSLTCLALLPRSRAHLYRIVHIDTDARLKEFAAALRAVPALASFVQDLRLGTIELDHRKHFWLWWAGSVLPRLPRLETLVLINLPEPLAASAVRFVQKYRKLNMVKRFHLRYPRLPTPEIVGYMASTFPYLEHLQILDAEPRGCRRFRWLIPHPCGAPKLTSLDLNIKNGSISTEIMSWFCDSTDIRHLTSLTCFIPELASHELGTVRHLIEVYNSTLSKIDIEIHRDLSHAMKGS